MRNRCFTILLVLAFCVVLTVPAEADMYLKHASYTEGYEMRGQTIPAQDDTTEIWLGDGVARADARVGAYVLMNAASIAQEIWIADGQGRGIETGRVYYLVNVAKKMLYKVNPVANSYTEMPFHALGDITKLMADDLGEEQLKAMQTILKRLQITAEVTPTEETKTIKNWNCKKYIISQGIILADTRTESWVTEEMNVDLTTLNLISLASAALITGFQGAKKEMEKVKGVTVHSEGMVKPMMGTEIKTTINLIEAAEKKAPVGFYEIPEGFTKATCLTINVTEEGEMGGVK